MYSKSCSKTCSVLCSLLLLNFESLNIKKIVCFQSVWVDEYFNFKGVVVMFRIRKVFYKVGIKKYLNIFSI